MVNALSEWIVPIYFHQLTNNEREILIPHEALPSYTARAVHRISIS